MIKAVKAATVRQSALQKGFEEVHGRDHEMFFYVLDGRREAIHVKLSHGTAELRIDEIKLNARAFKMRGEDLYKILCCDHDRAATERICRASIAEMRR